MSTIFYAPGTGGYFADRFPAEPGKTVILFAHGPDGFSVRVPDGVDWADYEEQPDLEVPQPDDGEGNPVPPVLVPQAPLRHPRDPWAYYQQAYPEIVGNAAQPDAEEANSWQPPEPEPLPETPVTDVETTKPRTQALTVEELAEARAAVASVAESAEKATNTAALKLSVATLAQAFDSVLAKLAGE